MVQAICYLLQDSWTLAKHLKTFPIRFKQSVENAQKIVSFLIKQDEISEVYYPGLTTAHLEQAKNGGAVIGFRLADEVESTTICRCTDITTRFSESGRC